MIPKNSFSLIHHRRIFYLVDNCLLLVNIQVFTKFTSDSSEISLLILPVLFSSKSLKALRFSKLGRVQ